MKTKYLIVDTTAFIQNAPLHDIGENMVTIQDVINEVRNKRQLRHLGSLTYDLEVKDVFSESLQFVAEFSKKTGDYPCLSATDLKVLALTYQLEKQYVGTDHINTCPTVKRTTDYTNRPVLTSNTAGFYFPTKNKSDTRKTDISTENLISDELKSNILDENKNIEQLENSNKILCNSDDDENIKKAASSISESKNEQDILSDLIEQCTVNVKDVSEGKYIEGKYRNNKNDASTTDNGSTDIDDSNSDADDSSSVVEQEENDDFLVYSDHDADDCSASDSAYSCDDDDDDDSWITPTNISSVKRTLNSGNFEDVPVTVGCITTDFAMQNVLKQMGLNIIALDGRVIKEMRTFILRCYACFKTTDNMRKIFCPSCGNKTLKRVAVSVDANGNQQIHVNLKKPLTARGKRFSLPMLKGGKHAVNPRLVEDSRRPHQRPSRLARIKTDALDPDYTAGSSPFAIRDIYSRSAQLGFAHGKPVFKYWMKKNPNEAKKTNRKRK